MAGRAGQRLLLAFQLAKILLFLGAGVLLSVHVVENPQDSMVARLVSYEKLRALLVQHLQIVGISSLLAIVTAVPVGVLLTRPGLRKWAPRVIGIVNIGQSVPSLAVVALSVGILGIGAPTAIIALWIYALLPILNNTMTGINGLNPSILEAASGMGMQARRVLFKIELPLAFPLMLSGIRTAVTINIGSAILAAFVGGGGLGNLIIAGNNISRWQVAVLGAVLPVIMALVVDTGFGLYEHHARNKWQ
jgi:osmoprotectant transport system permease protein